MIVDERVMTYIDSLNWQIPEYLKEMEKQALRDDVPVIRHGMQSLLCFLLKIRKPGAILEIGTAVGFSSILMSEYAPGAQIDTIENYPPRQKEARKNFDKFHKEGQIHLYPADAKDILARFVEEKRSYDFIFMDAAKGQYIHFLPSLLALLAKDGMLVTDNVLQDGDVMQSRYAVPRRNRTIHGRMRRYLYTLTHSDMLDTLLLPVGDGVSLSVFRDKEDKIC